MSKQTVVVARDHDRLKRLLAASSYRELAKAAGCSHQRVWDLAHSASCRITVSIAERVELALGVPRGSLFEVQVDPEYLPRVEGVAA